LYSNKNHVKSVSQTLPSKTSYIKWMVMFYDNQVSNSIFQIQCFYLQVEIMIHMKCKHVYETFATSNWNVDARFIEMLINHEFIPRIKYFTKNKISGVSVSLNSCIAFTWIHFYAKVYLSDIFLFHLLFLLSLI